MSELRFDDVRVRLGSGHHALTAVDGVDLTVPDGQVVGLVGESGSGKSTLARAALGLTPVSGGRVLLDGVPQRPRARRPVQMVFQDPYNSLDPRMTIGDSVAEAIPRNVIRGGPGRRREVARLLELVDLDPARATSHPAHLSGGQRQRVALARALAARPRILIADEITSALDVSIQGSVLNLIRTLQRELGLTMLFISHNLAVVRYISDQIAVIYLGQIVEHGPAHDILTNPQHPYTRDLLAATQPQPVDGRASFGDDRAPLSDTEPADPHNPPAGCRYHPRCPIGPLTHPDRTLCTTQAPTADGHPNHATCHFTQQAAFVHQPEGAP